MNKDLKDHKVQVLHERDAGKSYRFKSGSVYTAQPDGSYRRPIPKLSKAQRKQMKRARAQDRSLAAMSMATLSIA